MTNARTKAQWLDARLDLLEKEKAYARAGDESAVLRRSLPRLKVEQNYVFSGSDGEASLADLFEQRSQRRGAETHGVSVFVRDEDGTMNIEVVVVEESTSTLYLVS
ncbi:MAG: DUF899 domain-containing protein [Pseudomonadaceae bacterium]|nr:DUF899 domain-containing protein [Pseudomonadaceae bacterium]